MNEYYFQLFASACDNKNVHVADVTNREQIIYSALGKLSEKESDFIETLYPIYLASTDNVAYTANCRKVQSIFHLKGNSLKSYKRSIEKKLIKNIEDILVETLV